MSSDPIPNLVDLLETHGIRVFVVDIDSAVSARHAFGGHRKAFEVKELSLLKEEYGLSMSGILYRALDVGAITPALRNEWHRRFSVKHWRVTELGAQYPAEKAHVFEQLVFRALAEEYIGTSKAAELLRLSLTDFHRLRALESMDAPAHRGP